MTMRAVSLFAVAALLAGCNAIPTRRVVDSPGPAADHDPGPLRPAMLTAHNDARRAVGAPALDWDTALARDAEAYAGQLARAGRFDHSAQATRPGQGENLWMGARDAYSDSQMAGGWIDERRFFRPGLFPGNSSTANWRDVGHYTQIIWRTTLRVGCGVAANASDEYLVCRYAPQGNIVGRDPLND